MIEMPQMFRPHDMTGKFFRSRHMTSALSCDSQGLEYYIRVCL